MRKAYDVVIVGGGAIGSAAAYYLASNPDFSGNVLIVERDPSYKHASTSLSAASIRTQFSNAVNVKMSQYAGQVIRGFGEMMEVDGDRPDLGFHPGGYLYLASTPEGASELRRNHEVQISCGADVVLWDQEEIASAFPHLNVEDLQLASYGRSGEGWFNNTGLMNGFRRKARSLGVDVITDEVVGLTVGRGRVDEVQLASGDRVAAGVVVNASGPRASQLAAMAGISFPVEPRKRSVFVFKCENSPEGSARVNQGRLPLMIDPTGVYCRPEGNLFLAGCRPVDDVTVDFDDFEPRYSEFEDIIWPALAERSASFEAIRLVNFWAGHYAYNLLDQNLIIGPHPSVANFLFANGFSGHGLQQSPAVGRGISELVVYGEYRSLDLSEMGYGRILENRSSLEKVII